MKKNFAQALIGLLSGFANGLFGAGGGMILVPAMQKFLGIETRKAHATALAVILPLSVISMFVYLRGGYIDWTAVLFVSAGGAAGSFLGAKFLKKLSVNALHKIFALCMIAAAIRMIL
jgi:uncharacterized membrane protein YfcA